MDARAVLMVYSEEHDGAFWTEHGSPELCVPALARWIEACRRSGELPSAANYWEHIQADFVDQFTSTASCWDYVQAEHIADLDYLYEVRSSTAIGGWGADLIVWSKAAANYLPEQHAIIHRASVSNHITAPIHLLAAGLNKSHTPADARCGWD